MRHLAIVVLLLSACAAPTPGPHSTGKARAALTGCVTPEAHGAIAGDGLDDRVAFQAAIDAAQIGPGCLLAGPGRYDISRHPTAGAVNIQSLKISAPLVIQGAGIGETTIAMFGSGIRAGATTAADWWLIGVYSKLTISDLTLDGGARTNTSEQTHLLNLAAGARDVVVERVRFDLPTIGPSSGGDCWRAIGSATARVTGSTIRDVDFDHCDRAAMGFQRYVDSTTIQRVTTRHTETAIDLEPTGDAAATCLPIIDGISVSDSTLGRGDYASGDYTVSIAGRGCELASRIDIRSTTIRDGSMTILDAGDVTLTGLALVGRGSGAPVLQARKRIKRLRVVGGTITRPAGTSGMTVKITGQSGANPTDATLLGVTVVHDSDGSPVYAESLASLVLVACSIDYNGAPTTAKAVKNRGIDAPAGAPIVADTAITGPLGGIAEMAGTTDGGAPVVVRTTLAP